MINENTGLLYRFKLDFDLGFAYAEIIDFSDENEFDGILLKVYDCFSNTNKILEISDIINSKVIFGPVPINKIPKNKGRWLLLGKNNNPNINRPIFKDLRGLINKNNDWSKLEPWYKVSNVIKNFEPKLCSYEDVRGLETLILNHQEMIQIKVTMLYVLLHGEQVSKYYNLKISGNWNLYLQIINTYFSREVAIDLINAYP